MNEDVGFTIVSGSCLAEVVAVRPDYVDNITNTRVFRAYYKDIVMSKHASWSAPNDTLYKTLCAMTYAAVIEQMLDEGLYDMVSSMLGDYIVVMQMPELELDDCPVKFIGGNTIMHLLASVYEDKSLLYEFFDIIETEAESRGVSSDILSMTNNSGTTVLDVMQAE